MPPFHPQKYLILHNKLVTLLLSILVSSCEHFKFFLHSSLLSVGSFERDTGRNSARSSVYMHMCICSVCVEGDEGVEDNSQNSSLGAGD